MIDISLLREQPDALKASLVRRGLDLDVDLMAQIDRDRRSTRAKAESMRAEQKSLGRSIPRLESEARQTAIAEAGKLASSYRAALAEADELDEQFRMLWIKVPNPAHPSAADGLVEEDAVEIKRWGTVRDFDFPVKDHRELGAELGMIDIERAAKVSGSRFGYLTGPAVILEFALVRMALELLDTAGIFRVHQFDKVEMFSFCHPERSWDEHEMLLGIEEEIVQSLEIPYRVVNVAAGDLGASAAKKYDIEAWIPSQGRYREITSCSNTTDFQSRRMRIRFRTDGGNRLAHTLNGTAVAVGRLLIALLENHQQADGSVVVPDSLRAYAGFDRIG